MFEMRYETLDCNKPKRDVGGAASCMDMRRHAAAAAALMLQANPVPDRAAAPSAGFDQHPDHRRIQTAQSATSARVTSAVATSSISMSPAAITVGGAGRPVGVVHSFAGRHPLVASNARPAAR